MDLGNNNYSTKKIYIKDKAQIDEVFAALAVDFEEWFSQNYTKLQNELINKKAYDEDVITDTYLEIYDLIMYSGTSIKCYKSYFSRAYFYNYRSSRKEVAKNNDVDLCEVVDTPEQKSLQWNQDLLYDTLDKGLSPRESELLKMYYSSSNLTIKAIAKAISIPDYTAYYIIRRAKVKLKGKANLLRIIN